MADPTAPEVGAVPPLQEAESNSAGNVKLDQLTTFDVLDRYTISGKEGIRYNPDLLVGRKGLAVYGDMQYDDQIKACEDFKLAAMLARGWEFVYDKKSKLSTDEQQNRISLFEEIVERMQGSFDDVLENVSTSRTFGFSINEKVLSEIDVDGKTYIGVTKIVLRNPRSFRFKADQFGQLLEIQQYLALRSTVVVDPNDVIYRVHRPKWDQFYGQSELRSAYQWWYIKQQVVRMWPRYLEKFGGGFAVAKRDTDDAPRYGTPEYNSLTSALDNISALMSIVLPRGVSLDVHFPNSSDIYEKCITFCDLAIARSQLVPNLLGASHTGQTGAYAQSNTQFETFLWTVRKESTALATTLNEQLFHQLGDLNWGDKQYPCFRFKPASFDHIKWMLDTWRNLLQSGAVVASEQDEQFIRKLLEMPDRDPEDVLETPGMALQNQQAQNSQQSSDGGGKAAGADDEIQSQEGLTRRIEELERQIVKLTSYHQSQPSNTVVVNNGASADGSTTREAGHDSSRGSRVVPHEDLSGVTLEAFDRAVARVAFTVIANKTDDIAKQSISDLCGLFARSVKRALGSNEQLGSVIAAPSDIPNVDISASDRGKLKKSFSEVLDSGWALGSHMSRNELDRAMRVTTPLQARRAKFKALRDNAAEYLDALSFRMAGDSSDQARKIIQNILQNTVKNGGTLAEARAAIWDALVSKGLTSEDAVRGIETDEAVNDALDELWVDSEAAAVAYLNTLVRTNVFEAFNEARYAEFTDPELGDFVLALRYAAVLDSSTTEICSALDDCVWKTDSFEWDTYRPPNHYNCRSTLVAITAVDGWDGMESEQPSVEPQEGFK